MVRTSIGFQKDETTQTYDREEMKYMTRQSVRRKYGFSGFLFSLFFDVV
jgi:hypothetical protein